MVTEAEVSDSAVLSEITVSWKVADLCFLLLMEQALLVSTNCVPWTTVGLHTPSR